MDDPARHHRRSIRLKGYDYAWPGAYFVTICVEGREPLFGEIMGNEMRLNDAGQMVERWWAEQPHKFATIRTDAYVIMPSHVHGIVVITELTGSTAAVGATLGGRPEEPGHPQRGAPTLGEIVGWFKTKTTNDYILGVRARGWTPFPGRLWQRNYYEHVIRSEDEVERVGEYIRNNPMQWELDQENPANERSFREMKMQPSLERALRHKGLLRA